MENKPGDLEGLASTSGKAVEREIDATPTPKASAPAAATEVPDPDEDDLDDLDGQYTSNLSGTDLTLCRYAR